MHRKLMALALVLTVTATATTTWATQPLDHGPQVSGTVSRSDTFESDTYPLGTLPVVDDTLAELHGIGVYTATVTAWSMEGFVPWDGDPVVEPDGTSHRDGCYILYGGTSVLACLDGYVVTS